MAASIYRSSAVSSATFGTPDVSGLIVTGLTKSESTSLNEVKDDQGAVVAVAASEPVTEISIEGMRTGSFSATVGGTLSISGAGLPSGGTTIVTKLDTKFAAEQFESMSLSARHYGATMTEA
jgi:hypothetical protein